VYGRSVTGTGEESVKFATAGWIQSDRDVPLLLSKQQQPPPPTLLLLVAAAVVVEVVVVVVQ
jgi:hypothetical protein